jgi:hypothetical protein
MMYNFRPDVTLFYRPELYPRNYVTQIPGKKIAFLSEPLPILRGSRFEGSSETRLRLQVYSRMQWDCFDTVLYYDASKSETIDELGWPVTAFRPLPVDTHWFRPNRSRRPIDIFFIGKATPRRIAALDFLRRQKWRFVWVANGLSGRELASILRRSKIVLNIHADSLPAAEPRVYLAAACGCLVLSEPTASDVTPFTDQVIEYQGELDVAHIREALDTFERRASAWQASNAYCTLSTRSMLTELTSGQS